jgi:hypothetical protein
MNVTIWEHCTPDNQIFGCAKAYYSNSITIDNIT